MMEFDTTNWRMDKMVTLDQAQALAEKLRTEGKKLVTVNGSFDILHAGHLDQLEEAKKQGDVLFLGLNSDASIKAKKGDSRPLMPEQARAAMLASLACTDYVVIIDAPYDEVQNMLLRAIKPAVHVNGGDYGAVEEWIEWPVMQEVGATGYSVQHRNKLSTTELIKKIKTSS